MTMFLRQVLWLWCTCFWTASSFSHTGSCRPPERQCAGTGRRQVKLGAEQQKGSEADDLRDEAERLLQRAKKLRETIPQATVSTESATQTTSAVSKKWGVETSESQPGIGYRLYVVIGREEGSWMDPRWGASGKRVEFTLDVLYLTPDEEGGALADKAVQEKMVKDNFGGSSSPVFILKSAAKARLRSGFDSMNCHCGGYRIDTGKNGATVRFYIDVDGTPEVGSTYGDVSIPRGCLYFSLPCFGNGVSNLSTKEGIVSVRQIGWHTGWRREESRIAGVFRATPIEKARKRDGF